MLIPKICQKIFNSTEISSASNKPFILLIYFADRTFDQETVQQINCFDLNLLYEMHLNVPMVIRIQHKSTKLQLQLSQSDDKLQRQCDKLQRTFCSD